VVVFIVGAFRNDRRGRRRLLRADAIRNLCEPNRSIQLRDVSSYFQIDGLPGCGCRDLQQFLAMQARCDNPLGHDRVRREHVEATGE
jgi:hypothetical protein